MAKRYNVPFTRIISVVVEDDADMDKIIDKAVEIVNDADLEDMYMTTEDTNKDSIRLVEANVDDAEID